MAEVSIDITCDDDTFTVENPMGFDLRVVGCGLQIDLTLDQARDLFNALSPWFEDDAA